MSVMENERVQDLPLVEDLPLEDFDLDLQISVVTPDVTRVSGLQMDGYTTYATCHASCDCGVGSISHDGDSACA